MSDEKTTSAPGHSKEKQTRADTPPRVDLDDPAVKERLSSDAYKVLRFEATERPGSSPLNHEWRPGTYVCAACGHPLFRSDVKFDAHCGWPSFSEALPGAFETKTDYHIGYARTEYHCANCGGHHGHVFDDGPEPTGLRYCSNGVALRFVPEEGKDTA